MRPQLSEPQAMEGILKRLLTILLITTLALCGILIAGMAFLHFANLDPYRQQIEKIATKATGRQVEINGKFDINLFPELEVILNDMSLANAEWASEPTMVSVGHADATIAFLSLFSDTIIVRRIRLNDVTVMLEQNNQQVGNWVMGKTALGEGKKEKEEEKPDRDSDGTVTLPVMVDLAELNNITVTMRAPERLDQVYYLASFSLHPNESGNLTLISSGEVLGKEMEFNGEITSNESVLAHDAVCVDLQGVLGDAKLKGQMATSRLATLVDLNGTLHINVPDIQKALEKANIEAPVAGALTLNISAEKKHGAIDVVMKAQLDGIAADATAGLTDYQLRDVHLKLKIDDIQKTLATAKLEAPLTGPLTADATIKIDGAFYQTTAEATVEGITATINGSVAGKQLELRSTVAPLNHVGELFDLKGLITDALKIKAKVIRSGSNVYEIHQFQAEVGENRLSTKGRINMDTDSRLSLDLASPDLSTIIATLPAIDLNVRTSALCSAEKIALSDITVTFDKSDLNGDITLLLDDKQTITANLMSKLLDLRPFSEALKSDGGAEKASSKVDAEASAEIEAEPASHYVFKEEPFKLEPLQKVEADVKLAVDHFYYEQIELKNTVADASIHGGHVEAKFKCDSPRDGHVAAQIDLKTQGNRITVDEVVSLSDFPLNILNSDGIRPEDIPSTNLSLELKTAGISPRELASVANGRILFTQGPGIMSNNVMGMASNDIFDQLFSKLDPYAADEEFSKWDCTIALVNIVDGRATIDGILAQGEKVMIVGGGEIDLKTEKLDIEFNTQPRTGVGISADMFLTPYVKLLGTLASPAIGLNKKGTLLSGGAAVATGGLSFLVVGAFERATAQGDHCEKALQEVGDHLDVSF